jgi:NADH-quinone oxidoreductase subunit J
MDINIFGQILFYLFTIVIVGSAIVVVFSRSLIHSAFALLFTFFGVAVLYVYLGADFLAATQMIIYVGGILILLLFGVMLTHKLYDVKLTTESYQVLPALIVALSIFVMLAIVMLSAHWFQGGERPVAPTTAAIGSLFMNEYVLPFEVASIFLLVALIGAAMIVRRKAE